MKFNLAVLPGDGIGPDVVAEGVKLLQAVGRKYGHSFDLKYGLIGGCAIDESGLAITPETIKICRKSDAVILGAVGGPKWDNPLAKVRPEDGLLAIRKALGLFANLRPVKVLSMMINATSIKPEVLEGTDMVVVRELTGGLYFGKPKRQWTTSRGRRAVDTLAYSEQEVERIVRVGFELARGRRKHVVSVDKANVLESSRLWRKVASEVAADYPDVKLENMLVDTCSMRLIRTPSYFDIIVTENTFGDILTDEASMLSGSMGMLPSASLAGIPAEGSKSFGLYEPIHGSAPDIAGQDKANPLATILTLALMMRYSLGLKEEAQAVEKAADDILQEGYRTVDIMSEGGRPVGTREMGDLVAGRI